MVGMGIGCVRVIVVVMRMVGVFGYAGQDEWTRRCCPTIRADTLHMVVVAFLCGAHDH